MLILINGSNFIDGNNGITLGYFSIIFILLINLNQNDYIDYDKLLLASFILVLLILLFFNLLNKLYLGDSGVYILSIFSGYIIIDMFNQNQSISPYFIVNIFWYPAFEILFSIIRKFKFNKSPIYPDSNHLHQLLFYFLNKKNKLKNIHNNNLSTFIILIVNFLVFSIGISDIYSTRLQIFSIILAVIIYIFSYIVLFKFKFKKFNLM